MTGGPVAYPGPEPDPTMNLLWSYWYARTIKMDQFLGDLEVTRLRFFADSGAHSARTLGVAIQVDDYAAWLAQWAPWFTIYANLDVIGAPAATWDNQQRLEDHGLHPMPVYHTGEPISVLERYLDAGYTYIALGKLLGNPVARLRPWLARAFRAAEGRAVFHGFGLTTWQLLREFPFYSVDSSSWVSGVRFGNLKLFHRGRWSYVTLRDRESIAKHRAVLKAYGLPVRSLTQGGYDRAAVAGACAVAMYRANQYLRRIHGPVELPPGRGYPPPGDPVRPKIVRPHGATGAQTYLANSDLGVHKWHASGLQLYLADASAQHTPTAAAAIGRETGPHTYLADSERINHQLHADALVQDAQNPRGVST